MHRYELTDTQWARIEPFLPHRTHHGKAGHPFNDHRPLVNGILWILHTEAPWRDRPERDGPCKTVSDRFYRWRGDGTLVRIVTVLLDELDDKRIRRWCRRRRVEAVIPTRKDQPRDENLDKETYKRRNIVERVVSWYQEYRRLGTRYEKLAINYVAMWLVAIMEKPSNDYCRTEPTT